MSALEDLPKLLRSEPAFTALLGTGAAHVAVPEAARALFVAGVASLSERHPLLIATPTAADAQPSAAAGAVPVCTTTPPCRMLMR